MSGNGLMEGGQLPITSIRKAKLKNSLRLVINRLLTVLSKEDVQKGFSTFSNAEKESINRMFVQVIKSIHANIEEAFDSLCQESEVGFAMDTMEELVEEHDIDILSADEVGSGRASGVKPCRYVFSKDCILVLLESINNTIFGAGPAFLRDEA